MSKKSHSIECADDVRKVLGFSGEPSDCDLLQLYHDAIDNGGDHEQARLAWKIANDTYYWETLKAYPSFDFLTKAGFFDDGLEPGVLETFAGTKFLTTPLEHIRQKVDELKRSGAFDNKPLAVAVTTGCFAPVHAGHIAMMEQAKQALEDKGYEVLGGFMVPAHDDYVSTKGEIAQRLTADHRILLMNKALDGSDWLSTDPWLARYAPTDINFTDVLQRLDDYIHKHLGAELEIDMAYVFGGDNADFAYSFIDKGLAVCVPRPGHEEKLEVFAQSVPLEQSRFMISKSSGHNLSSSDVRGGASPALSQLSEDDGYKKLMAGEARMPSDEAVTNTYLLRDDLKWATQDWADKIAPESLAAALENFKTGLIRAIKDAFAQSNVAGYPNSVEVLTLSAEDQIADAQALMMDRPGRVINNDLVTGKDESIGLSRLFHLSGFQSYSKTFAARRSAEHLRNALSALSPGDYAFVDDDIASGTTIRMFENELPEGVHIQEKIALSELAFNRFYPDQEYAFWDIVDTRDFLLGAKKSGLVVQLFNGEIGRAPYILPYTSLVSRAKIPPDQEIGFTKAVIDLNAEFFESAGAALTVGDTEPQFQALLRTLDYDDHASMAKVCRDHQEMFGQNF